MVKKYHIDMRNSSEIDDGLLTLGERETSRQSSLLNRTNVRWAWGFLLLIFFIFFGRLYFLNVVRGGYYSEKALNNKTREYALPAPRGKIYDRNGKILVNNIPSTNIVAIDSYLPSNPQTQSELIRGIASLFDLSEEEVLETLSEMKKSRQPQTTLKRDASRDEVLRFLEKQENFPGIALEQSVRRQYEESAIFSHIIGYEGKMTANELEQYPDYALNDSVGRQGLERSYEKYLRGVSGAKRLEVDAFGRVQKEIASRDPLPGNDLVLSVDGDLQKKLFDAMSQELEKSNLKSGAAVAMNPQNGEILALVSFPAFDNNVFSGGGDKEEYARIMQNSERPLFNRVISGMYPPGSTIKPIIAAAALSEGVISEGRQIESRGSISIGKFTFGDWKAHGFTDVRHAIAVSSDVYFYSVGGGYGDIPGLGMTRMKKYDELFGLGEKTGIDLPSEAAGFIPDEVWKQKTFGERWYVGDSYHAAIGQGYVTATPLQMAVAVSAIANGGTLYQPKIVSQVTDGLGQVASSSPIIRRKDLVPDSILRIIREGMRLTVTEGTARQLNDISVSVAGKTGTAQFGTEEKTHGWFEAFAPYENPEIVLVVMMEGQFKEDTYNAVPVSHEVLKWYFERNK